MLTVNADVDGVEQELRDGKLTCPDCSGILAGWGYARRRELRGEGGKNVRLRPRRARCMGCDRTHVLLPPTVLLRRADTVGVIGRALAAKARGHGFRRIAVELGLSAETVRGWLRRFARRLEPVRSMFTRWLRELDADPVVPAPAGSAWADAVTAIRAAATAAATRFQVGAVAPWELAVTISAGRLLAPGWPTV